MVGWFGFARGVCVCGFLLFGSLGFLFLGLLNVIKCLLRDAQHSHFK